MRLAVFCCLLATLIVACEQERAPLDPETDLATETPDIPFRQDGTLDFILDGEPVVSIAIEIADTDSARARGLMQRTSLPDRSGMLFVFEREEPQGFWMANTPLSLDLAFVNADSQIVHVAKYTRPLSDDLIPSEAPALYVVEVPAGFADTYGISEDMTVQWKRTDGS